LTRAEVESSWRDRAKQMEALNQAALAAVRQRLLN
jgi:hypothetical protein